MTYAYLAIDEKGNPIAAFLDRGELAAFAAEVNQNTIIGISEMSVPLMGGIEKGLWNFGTEVIR